jgi:hypothetical protein
MMKTLRLSLFAGCAALSCAATAQFDLPDIGLPDIKLPSLTDLLEGEDPLTTTIADAPNYGWPELDSLRYSDPVVLTQEDRNEEGFWDLQPGHYVAEIESFCAKGYSYGPTEGMGYVYSAWRGSKVDFLQELLRRYNLNEDVSQYDMQLLIWAVLAKTDPADMRGGARTALVQLMGDRGVELMARGAINHYANEAFADLLSEADDAMRPILRYQNQMRGLFAEANASYEQFEELAMLPPPNEPPLSVIPAERWNIHPAGYAMRYDPSGYSRTRFEIVVPDVPDVVRDELNRVTQLEWSDGWTLEIGYADEPGVPYAEDTGLTAYRVDRYAIDTGDPETSFDAEVDSWVFQGVPTGEARPVDQMLNSVGVRMFQFGWFRNGQERYEQVQEQRERFESYQEWYERTQRIEAGEEPDEAVFDSGHVEDLGDSLRGSQDDRLEQIGETHGRLAEWLAYATRQIESLGEDGSMPTNPGDGIMQPGNGGSQRLMGSSRTF